MERQQSKKQKEMFAKMLAAIRNPHQAEFERRFAELQR